jgi:pSer/pThr/pTyr-binding forkhead associated (FHA) protein
VRAHLIPLNTEYPPIQIIRDVTLVGRQKDLCDIFLPEVSVSKIHCLIVRTDGLLFIRDLGSTNGTKVNGQRVTRGALLPGDVLAFAGEKFRVEMGPGEPDLPEAEFQVVPTEVVNSFKSGPSYLIPQAQSVQASDSDVRLLDAGD